MKRLYVLIVAAALCFPSIGAWAWWQSIEQVSVGAPVVFSLAWQASAVESAGGTVITYPALAFGATDPNRYLVVVAAARMATVNTIVSMTIGGQAASLVPSSTATVAGTNGSNSSIWQLTSPLAAGTSGDVVITWGAATSRTGVSLYRLVTSTPTASSANNAVVTGSAVLSTTITVPVGGGGIAGVWENSGVIATGWTGATQDTTLTAGGSSVFATATASGSGSVTPAPFGASTVSNTIESAAAWGP